MPVTYSTLTPDQRDHFLEHGWIKISGGVSQENIARFMDAPFVRQGWDGDDKSTWNEHVVKWSPLRRVSMKEFVAEDTWGAICDLLGGEDRLDLSKEPGSCQVTDALIGNFGSEKTENTIVLPQDQGGFHCDGNSFMRFLDSPERALLLIILFSDVEEDGGPTLACEDGMSAWSTWLHDHPQGTNWRESACKQSAEAVIPNCRRFAYATGKAGDVYLQHFLLPHTTTHNPKRLMRFITNPYVAVKEPFQYDREDPADYSLVELKTLHSLGVTSLPGWKSSGATKRIEGEAPQWGGKVKRIPIESARLEAWASEHPEEWEKVGEGEKYWLKSGPEDYMLWG